MIDFDSMLLVLHFSTTVLASNFYKHEVIALVQRFDLIDFDSMLLVLHFSTTVLASNFYKHEVTTRVHLLLAVSTGAHFWISHSKNQEIVKTI